MRTGGLGTEPDQLFDLRETHGKRLFDEDVLPGKEGGLRVGIMVARAGGDGDELDVGVGEHVFIAGVGLRAEFLGEGDGAFFDDVADGGEAEFVLPAAQLTAVHAVAGASEPDESDADGIHVHMGSPFPLCGLRRGKMTALPPVSAPIISYFLLPVNSRAENPRFFSAGGVHEFMRRSQIGLEIPGFMGYNVT